MLISIVVESDKTMTFMASNHQEFHPVYVGLGNINNSTRWAHGLEILPYAFLLISKDMILSLILFFGT